MVLVMEFKGRIGVRVWNKTDVGELRRDPVRLVLHAVLDQLTQRVELCSAAEPHLSLVRLHIVIHIFIDLGLRGSSIEVFQLGILISFFSLTGNIYLKRKRQDTKTR